jgi:hypothetical protein
MILEVIPSTAVINENKPMFAAKKTGDGRKDGG